MPVALSIPRELTVAMLAVLPKRLVIRTLDTFRLLLAFAAADRRRSAEDATPLIIIADILDVGCTVLLCSVGLEVAICLRDVRCVCSGGQVSVCVRELVSLF